MSFPRAKIQRFNDILNDVPSPTKYDPKVGDKVKGGCILKGESKHSANSDNASVVSSKSVPTPVFRTPLVPKKHNCLGVTPSSEKSTPAAFKSISLKHEDFDFLTQPGDSEDLNALRTECRNKNETIAELEKFVQELKQEIFNHEKNKAELESCIVELEATKSNLECIKSNHDNYEQQIRNYVEKIKQLEEEIEILGKAKEELMLKIEETEKKNNKLEEVNLDCERKIISLEGTIEQLQGEIENNQKAINELKHNEEVHEMNYTVSVECLKGKISALDNEIKELEKNKSKNEATIFGLETQISTLNSIIENLRKENGDIDSAKTELKGKLNETEEVLKQQKEAYELLSKQLDERTLEITKLNDENKQLKSEFEAFKSDFENERGALTEKNLEITSSYEKRLNDLETEHSSELDLLNKEIRHLKCKVTEQQKIIQQKEEEFSSTVNDLQTSLELQISSLKEELTTKEIKFQEDIKELQDKTEDLLRKHAEEVHLMQNEYETELLQQMQEYTDKINSLQDYIDEKEALLNETNEKYLRLTAEAKIEYEKTLLETERSMNNLINEMNSDHLLKVNKLKEENVKKIENIELDWRNKINLKDKEIETLTKEYKNIVDEMQDLLKDIDKKDEEMKKLTAANETLNGRLKMMLEEIKILNVENETKCKDLQEMISKYEDEALKNSKLSEKLGELDCIISQQKKELKTRIAEEERLAAELKKFKEANARLHMNKYDLEITVVELKDNINNLTTNMNMERATFENKLHKVNTELTDVKKQCRKFEIVMTDTRKSLEVLGERLIESENEVEKLSNERLDLRTKLDLIEKERNDIEAKFKSVLEAKSVAEEKILKFTSENEELSKKCSDLETSCKEFEQNVSNLTQVKEELEADRKSYDENIQILNNLIKTQELQLIETERAALEQIESVHKMIMEKLQFFSEFWLEKNQALVAETKKLKGECEATKSLLKSKTEEYENLVTDNEILKTTSEITMKECQDLKKQYEDQTIKIEDLEGELKDLNHERTVMKEKLKMTEAELDSLNEKYEIMCEKLSKNEELMEDLQLKRESDRKIQMDLEAEIEDQTKKVKELKENLEESEIKIKAMETDLIKKMEELDQRNADVKTYREANKELQQKIQKNCGEFEELLLHLEALRNMTETLQKSNEKSEKEIEILKKEKLNMEEVSNEQAAKLKALEDCLKNKENECKSIKGESKALSEEKERLKQCLNELQRKNSEIEHDYKTKCEELITDKTEVEERKEYYKAQCKRLEKMIDELMKDKADVQKDFDEIHIILQAKDSKIEELQKTNAELQSLIGPFREQLSHYETERMLIESDREQLRKQHLEQAAKLGHQNHKQKIQHVVKLKDELLRLRKENEKLTLEVKNSKKMIEKLREQVGDHPKRLFIGGKRPASTPFKGKENNSTLLSPNAGIITPMSVKQEPISPASPLRERSQTISFSWKK